AHSRGTPRRLRRGRRSPAALLAAGSGRPRGETLARRPGSRRCETGIGWGLAAGAGGRTSAVSGPRVTRGRWCVDRSIRAAACADGGHLPPRRPGRARMIRWHKVKTVAAFEFFATVKRPGYLIATFGMPLFLAAYAGIVAIPGYYAAKRDREPVV